MHALRAYLLRTHRRTYNPIDKVASPLRGSSHTRTKKKKPEGMFCIIILFIKFQSNLDYPDFSIVWTISSGSRSFSWWRSLENIMIRSSWATTVGSVENEDPVNEDPKTREFSFSGFSFSILSAPVWFIFDLGIENFVWNTYIFLSKGGCFRPKCKCSD